jgi:hypothetical protein
MRLPINHRLWQPPISLGFNTDLMAGFHGLKPSQNLGLNFNPGQVSTPKLGSKLNSALGIAGGIAGGLVDLYQGIDADTSDIENAVDQQVDALGNIKYTNATSMDDLMNKQSSYRGLKANHEASEFYQGPSTGGIFANALSKGASAAMSASSTSPIGMAIAGGLSLAGSLAGGLIGRNKQQKVADSETARLNAEERRKNAFMEASYRTDADNLVTKNNRNLMSQIAAYGGPLGISLNPVHGAIDFMQNEELLDSLEGDTTKTNRKTSLPEFAFGGALGGYGGDWSNGLTFVKAGGSHERNPLGGVPMGMAEDGQPNLVEEGEVVWNHPILANGGYVFTKRHNIPKWLQDKYKLGDEPITYAAAVDKLQQAISERPNDPIEQKTLEAELAEFMGVQEEWRQKKEMQDMNKQEAHYAAHDGPKGRQPDWNNRRRKKAIGGYLFPDGGYTIPYAWNAELQDMLNKSWKNSVAERSPYIKEFNQLNNTNMSWGQVRDIIRNNGYTMQENPQNSVLPVAEDNMFTPTLNIDLNTGNWYQNYLNRQNSSIFRDAVTLGKNTTFNTGTYDAMGNWVPPTTLSFNYKGLPSSNTTTVVKKPDEEKGQRDLLPTSGWQTRLRYAPILGGAIGLAHTLFNKPDYEYANELSALADTYANQVGRNRITPKFLGDRLTYNPFDRIFYANELGAQQAATNAAIRNQSNGNRGQAIASLLTSSYGSNIDLGKLFREGEEYNLAQRQKVAEFNRGTNQYNSEADLKAQIANAELMKDKANLSLAYKAKALGMKQADDQAYQNALMDNLTGLFQGVGDIGWEAVNRNMINSNLGLYYGMKPNGELYYKKAYYDLPPEERAEIDAMGIKVNKDGGYLTIKNRRRK